MITFDSGTSLMSVPTAAANLLTKNGIPLTNNIHSCNSHEDYGDMTLLIGNDEYKLSNEEWMFPAQQPSLVQNGQMTFAKGPLGPQLLAQVDSDSDKESLADSKSQFHKNTNTKVTVPTFGKGQKACASTIMIMDIGQDMFLVGDVFMRKYYTVFDRDNDRVGLAEAVTNDKVRALHQVPMNNVKP